MNKTEILISEMIAYYAGDVKRINHFLKVYAFAKTIGEKEMLTSSEQSILEVASITHDIGIKMSEEKYQSSAGHYQQLEGPPVAHEMLKRLGYDQSFIDRACYLIARHHTYTDIDNMDYQILVEADFLVNIFEDCLSKEAAKQIRDKHFKTATGTEFLDKLYL